MIEYDTQHFAFWYGIDQTAASYKWEANLGTNWQVFLNLGGDWMEKVWAMDTTILINPMPYAGSDAPRKINIYVCGTGLPFGDNNDKGDCGASGAQSMWVSAIYLQPGSTAMIHEFGHTTQFYTGGFQNNDYAGPLWETGANWNSNTLSPSYDSGAFYYLSNLENGVVWSYARYGEYPWMMYIYENDKTRDLLWGIWQKGLRDSSGNSTEDPVPALIRLGQANGAYPSGIQSFNDDMGWYAARLPAADFNEQKMFFDIFTNHAIATRFAPLATTSTSGNYASPKKRPLYEYGIHIVPLTPSSGADTIAVQLTGATSTGNAAWRFSIVGLDSSHSPTYSQLESVTGTASAVTAINVVSGLTYYLVVIATPTQYKSFIWDDTSGTTTMPAFPYTVQMKGATPLTGAANMCTSHSESDAEDYNWDTNGHKTGDTGPMSCPAQ